MWGLSFVHIDKDVELWEKLHFSKQHQQKKQRFVFWILFVMRGLRLGIPAGSQVLQTLMSRHSIICCLKLDKWSTVNIVSSLQAIVHKNALCPLYGVVLVIMHSSSSFSSKLYLLLESVRIQLSLYKIYFAISCIHYFLI